MSSFFSRSNPNKKRKLSTLLVLDESFKKEIGNIKQLIKEEIENIDRIYSQYRPDFHSDYIDREAIKSESVEPINRLKKLRQKLDKFEHKLHDVFTSLQEQTKIKEEERKKEEKILKKLISLRRTEFNEDVRTQIFDYVGELELQLSNDRVYKSPQKSSWFAGKSRKQNERKSKKQRKSRKNK
jgi:hypothetical protein